MNETEFLKVSGEMLGRIARAIDEAGVDCDCNFKGEGVLEVEIDDGNKIIINRHTAAREIWVAAPSGGFHFRVNEGQWVDTREGTPLARKLSELLATRLDLQESS